MRITSTTDAPKSTTADTIAVGVFEDEGVAHDLDGAPLQGLIDAGEAKRSFKHLAHTHIDGKRWIVAGLGKREEWTAERGRTAAAGVLARAKELGTTTLTWEVPHHIEADSLVEGTVLAHYSFDAFRSKPDESNGPQELILSAHDDIGEIVQRAGAIAQAQNRARDLQNAPANHMTPTMLAERARTIEGVTVEILGRDEIITAGMGAFAAVAQGSYEEPTLITMRYDGAGADPEAPLLALVGKAVTFDTGGISLKPGSKMSEMKFDMSGGAAVIEAMSAIAELALPVRVLAVVGATENMPSGRSIKPGDIVTTKAGITVEINNTDAEGRLVLADCLAHAVELGAQRIVDIATLTGGVIVALGSSYAGLQSNDEDWAAELLAAAQASGEEIWRLPLHDDYRELVKGRYADLDNAPEARKASSSIGAVFLERFVGDVPWAHLDIAGVAWDQGRAYAAKGGNGFGVRLLVELASALSPAGSVVDGQ